MSEKEKERQVTPTLSAETVLVFRKELCLLADAPTPGVFPKPLSHSSILNI